MMLREAEEYMFDLMQGAIYVATEVIKTKPFSLENRDQREAAVLLNNPWVIANINKTSGELSPVHSRLKETYLDYLRKQLQRPNGSSSVLERLSKAQQVLLGE